MASTANLPDESLLQHDISSCAGSREVRKVQERAWREGLRGGHAALYCLCFERGANFRKVWSWMDRPPETGFGPDALDLTYCSQRSPYRQSNVSHTHFLLTPLRSFLRCRMMRQDPRGLRSPHSFRDILALHWHSSRMRGGTGCSIDRGSIGWKGFLWHP